MPVNPDALRIRRDSRAIRIQSAKVNCVTIVPLSAGTKLGPYEIRASIGVGGKLSDHRARLFVIENPCARMQCAAFLIQLCVSRELRDEVPALIRGGMVRFEKSGPECA